MLKMSGWKLEKDGVILTVTHTAPHFKVEYEVKLDVYDFEMLSKNSSEWFSYWHKHGNLPSERFALKTK